MFERTVMTNMYARAKSLVVVGMGMGFRRMA